MMSVEESLVVIITAKDEFGRLRDLRDDLVDYPQVLLVDDYSADGSPTAASEWGWDVRQRAYVGQADQLNWALSQLSSDQWALVIDSDELPCFTRAELVSEILFAKRAGMSAVALRRHNYFGRRLLRGGGFAPDWQVRVMSSELRYEVTPVHSHVVVDESRIRFSNLFLTHQTYNDVDHYIDKYAAFLALESRKPVGPSARPRYRRIRVLEDKVPFPAAARFFLDYVMRGGFRDGRFGFYSALWAGYRASIRRGARHMRNDEALSALARTFSRD